MADVGPPAPQAPLAPQPPTQSVQLPIPQAQPVLVPQLNWSHFKPEFAGKPNEEEEAHLLRMSHWMDTHQFQEGVQPFLFNTSRRSKIMV